MLDDVFSFLVACGVVSAGWKMQKGDMTDDQDQVIGLFETIGWAADTLNRENEMVGLSMRVRGVRDDYVGARAKWKEVFDYLQDAQDTHTGYLTGYAFIQSMGFGPGTWRDPKSRPNFTSNFRVKKLRS